MNGVVRVRVLLGALVVFVLILSLGAGCGQASSQSSELEAQQQENEELRKELEAREAEQEEAAEEQEAAEREEMQQRIEELEEQAAEGQDEPQQAEEPASDAPDVVIGSNEDWTAPPSQAPEGVVVVSPDYNVQAVTAEEAEALDAAIAYYQAVEIGDYYTTHGLLSVDDQNLYPLDQWVTANTNLDSAAGEFVVTGAYPDDIGNYSAAYAVTVAVYLPDGSSFDRTTYFTDEGNGYWAHWLSQEEMDLFNGAL